MTQTQPLEIGATVASEYGPVTIIGPCDGYPDYLIVTMRNPFSDTGLVSRLPIRKESLRP